MLLLFALSSIAFAAGEGPCEICSCHHYIDDKEYFAICTCGHSYGGHKDKQIIHPTKGCEICSCYHYIDDKELFAICTCGHTYGSHKESKN